MSKILLNIPHSSEFIPKYLREEILISDNELEKEVNTMTDLYVDKIFSAKKLGIDAKDILKADFSRLICDVERFENDSDEIMSEIGMGAVYTKTSHGEKLRNNDIKCRKHIIENYYKPYHKKFEAAVSKRLDKYDECIILDCHSFNPNAKYLDFGECADICLGVNGHTPQWLVNTAKNLFEKAGYTVSINSPFSGTIVPLAYYNVDMRVSSMMIEINRKIYAKHHLGDIVEDKNKVNKVSKVCKEFIEVIKTI